jgi:hypothetical protein
MIAAALRPLALIIQHAPCVKKGSDDNTAQGQFYTRCAGRRICSIYINPSNPIATPCLRNTAARLHPSNNTGYPPT